MNRVSAVIVTYNRFDALKQAVTESLKQGFEEVFVINNASNDQTRNWLDEQSALFPTLRIKHLAENIGGAGGFNEGMRWAAEVSEAEWICCFDDDAYPDQNCIQRFRSRAFETETAVAAAVYTENGLVNDMNRPGFHPITLRYLFPTLLFGKHGHHLKDESYQGGQQIDVDYSSFVGLFVKREWVVKGNLPRADFFIYADDVMYTLEITSQGQRLVFDPDIRFIHADQTLGNESGKFHPLWKAFYVVRNEVEVYRFLAGGWFPVFLLLKIVKWFLSVFSYQENRKAYLKLVMYAVKDGLGRNFNRSLSEVKRLAES